MSVTSELGAVPVQSDGFNNALSPVVYGDIALSIDTQYNLQVLQIMTTDTNTDDSITVGERLHCGGKRDR